MSPLEKKDFEPKPDKEPVAKKEKADPVADADAARQKALEAEYAKNNLDPDIEPSEYVAPSAYADKVDKDTIVDAPPTTGADK
jgi:hypothetical protein